MGDDEKAPSRPPHNGGSKVRMVVELKGDFQGWVEGSYPADDV